MLHEAVTASDANQALAAFEALASSSSWLPAPERWLYNGLASLLVTQPMAQARVLAHMRQRGVSRDETTLTLEVRGLVQSGSLDAAVDLLTSSDETVSPRLRTYTELLHALAEHKLLERCGVLQDRLASRGLELNDEGLLVELAVLAAGQGEAAALHHNLTALQATKAALQPDSLRTLERGLSGGGATATARLTSLSTDGVCGGCGERLGPLALAPETHEVVCSRLRSAVRSLGDAALTDFDAFDAFVTARRFDVVVDGANAAYRHQNFEGGKFSFEQVEAARVALSARYASGGGASGGGGAAGAQPLLLLPQRYLAADRVPNHARSAALAAARAPTAAADAPAAPAEPSSAVSEADAALVRSWRASGSLWAVPDAVDDDYYWMLAVLRAGATAVVLTNDQMRDHKFMLALTHQQQREFARWQSRHVASFGFSHASMAGKPPPSLLLQEPPRVAQQIHHNERTGSWHLPSAAEGEAGAVCKDAWLCVQSGGEAKGESG